VRRVVKVSYDQKKVLVRYEQPRAGDADEFEIVCKDKPAPEFVAALVALRKHVAEICELGDLYCKDLEVRGASFSYAGEGEVMGATITALKKVTTARSPLVLNTPHLPSEPYTEDDKSGTPCLSDEAVGALDDLCLRALEYVDGKRAQVEMFADAAKGS
jgi:hypothetical protein